MVGVALYRSPVDVCFNEAPTQYNAVAAAAAAVARCVNITENNSRIPSSSTSRWSIPQGKPAANVLLVSA